MKPISIASRAAARVIAGILLLAATVHADEIKVLTSGGFAAALLDVVPEFERATQNTVVTAFGASMGNAPDSIPSRLNRGEPVDVVILADTALDELIKQGKVVAGSRVDLVRSRIGMAVRAGAPKPDISTVDALRRTLLQARSIAYSSSASGIYLSTELFQRLGIADQVMPKSKRIESERVGTVVARGDAEIGFQQISELLPVPGIEYVGPLPPDVQKVTVFSAGVAAGASKPDAARALIKFLASPAAVPAIRKSGLDPVPSPSQDVAAQSRSPLDLANAAVPAGARRIAYGREPLQFGELRLPSTKSPHPVAIVVHGGCWLAQIRDMDQRAVAIDNMRPLAAALTAAGIATWNVEYRRLGHKGGGWPGTFQDVAHAADFVRTLARDNHLDLTRVIAIGHSAGGHLAMWLAARPKLPKSSELYTSDPLRLTGVVNLDGPADLKATLPLQQPVCGSPVITDLIGGLPDERPERYRHASPIELLPLGVRQEFFAGRMFAAHVAPYEMATRRTGDTVNTTVLADAGHFVFIDPESAVWPQVMTSVRRVLSITDPGGTMLNAAKLMAFAATSDASRARAFYEKTLGLRLVSDEAFALVFDSNGTQLRIQKAQKTQPLPFTVLGWEVANIEETMAALRERGVVFERFGSVRQDDLGVWTADDRTKVAWFKDPDGNLLSITQFK
jgi:molybdate transport system substrate-binding protein